MKRYLGIDIGGTNIKVVGMEASGQILFKEEQSTEDGDQRVWKQKIIDTIDIRTRELTNGDPSRLICGISSPGLADARNSCILHMPERLKGIENHCWAQNLNREIWALNDAHAATLAEYHSFHRNTVQHMLLLTLGTGVGGGAIINGELYQGAINRGGHFGHISLEHNGPITMTNMPGSLEYAIGNFSVKERTHGQYTTTRALVEAYEAGDPMAIYWWLSSVKRLSVGLASLINAFSPECIVLGGGITAAGAALFAPLHRFMSFFEWQPGGYQTKIIPAQHGKYAGAIGAALFSKRKHQL